MGVVGVPKPFVAFMRITPAFKKLKAVAHTLPRDAAIVLAGIRHNERVLDGDRWTAITAPVTVIDGGKSPDSMRNANADLATVLGADYRTLEGQTHMVKTKVLAPALIEVLVKDEAVALAA